MTWMRPVVASGLRRLAARGPRGTGRAVRVVRRLPDDWHREQVVRTRIDGLRYELELGDNAQRELYYLGAYERPFLDFLRRELRRDDVVLDVGGHVGIFALPLGQRLAQLGGGRVVTVEASPTTAARLRQHVDRNDLAAVVEVVQVALTDEPGPVSFHGDPDFGLADRAVRSRFGVGEPVETVEGHPFDDLDVARGLERLDVVKIDIEGSELHALRGMCRTLDRLRPRLVSVECKPYILERAGTSQADVDALMADLGYARQAPLSTELGLGHRLAHVDDNVLYRPVARRG